MGWKKPVTKKLLEILKDLVPVFATATTDAMVDRFWTRVAGRLADADIDGCVGHNGDDCRIKLQQIYRYYKVELDELAEDLAGYAAQPLPFGADTVLQDYDDDELISTVKGTGVEHDDGQIIGGVQIDHFNGAGQEDKVQDDGKARGGVLIHAELISTVKGTAAAAHGDGQIIGGVHDHFTSGGESDHFNGAGKEINRGVDEEDGIHPDVILAAEALMLISADIHHPPILIL